MKYYVSWKTFSFVRELCKTIRLLGIPIKEIIEDCQA